MKHSQVLFLAAGIAILAGCASQPQAPAGPPGKHLVYRDSGGAVLRQFDYPDDAFCRKVEAVAGRGARCQAESVSGQLQAKATLRYNPPGIVVESHYADMARCQRDNSSMSPGVELLNQCTPK